jgi:hypothetical protein
VSFVSACLADDICIVFEGTPVFFEDPLEKPKVCIFSKIYILKAYIFSSNLL